jgi:hypothetical protein
METFGRLHIVYKTKREFTCRECSNKIEIGKSCYRQNFYSEEGAFPQPTRVCMVCGQKQIDNGKEVVK